MIIENSKHNWRIEVARIGRGSSPVGLGAKGVRPWLLPRPERFGARSPCASDRRRFACR